MFNNGLFTEAEGMFTRKDLMKLLAPLIVEQILAVLVGMVDVMMVAAVGEAAVSGVSLVDSISVSGEKTIGKCLPGGGPAGWSYNNTVSDRDNGGFNWKSPSPGGCVWKSGNSGNE